MKKFIIQIAGFLALSLSVSGADMNPALVGFLKEYLSIKYRDTSFDRFIYVAAKKQKLYLIEGEEIIASYNISTAKNGIGQNSGSFKTPAGLHQIAEKVGEDLPINSIIKQKVATGELARPIEIAESTNQDFITSRVMHLKGMEPQVNSGGKVDSYERGIFIHGTHEEGLIGQAASKGCVRMTNSDVIDLFQRVEVGTFVVILNN